MRWYKHDHVAFIDGTMGMDLETKGAYFMVLNLIYARGSPIADDDRWIAGVCGCTPHKWRKLKTKLIDSGKLYLDDDGNLSNPRCDEEIARIKKTKKTDKKREKNENNFTKNQNKIQKLEVISNENNNLHTPSRAGLDLDIDIDKKEEENTKTYFPQPVASAPRRGDDKMKEILFDEGKEFLGQKSGGLFAKLLQKSGQDVYAVYQLLKDAKKERPADPASWMMARVTPFQADEDEHTKFKNKLRKELGL